MDFTPTEAQQDVRELAASLLATGTPAERGLAGFDTALWARLGAAGVLGLDLPEELGGSDLGLAEISVLAEETGRAASRVPVVAVLAALPSLVGQPALVAAVLAGEAIVVPALSPAGVEDPMRPSVHAIRVGDGWLVSGTRLAVAWARQASHLLVVARTDDDELLLVLLSTDSPGLALIDEQVSSGEPHASLLMDGVRVGDADLLATGPAASTALAAALTRLTLLQCAHAVGVAEHALKLAAEHVSQREQFGRPLATFQAVTVRVADCWIDVEAMRLTMQQAVWRVDEGLPAAEQTAIAAFWGAEGVQRVVGAAVHLHGGLGVDISYSLHRWFLAGKVDELSLGGAQRRLEHLGDLLAART